MKGWMMKTNTLPATLLAAGLVFCVVFSACEDERSLPDTPDDSSYTETFSLLDSVTASGKDCIGEFTPLDNIVSGFIAVTCIFQSDADLNTYDRLGTEIDTLKAEIESITAEKDNIEEKDTLMTHEDTLKVLELLFEIAEKDSAIVENELQQDILDTYLDDRFKLSVWMEGDDAEYYSHAVFLDASSRDFHDSLMSYLGDEVIVWGQGIYLSPVDIDTTSVWRGMTIKLDFEEYWVADGGWDIGGGTPFIHTGKLEDRLSLKSISYARRNNLYPIRDMITRLTPGATHKIHFRFGTESTATRLTASLYVVYENKWRRDQ